MKLPLDLFKSNILPRKVYYFSSDKLNTITPHYFICIARTADDMLILVCCTSQFEKRKKFIELRGFPFETLVWLKPNSENGLKIDSYVDCNSYFDYTIDEFARLYDSDILTFEGEISEADMEQIKIGIEESPLVEESIKELVR